MSNKYLNKGFIQQLNGQKEGEGVCKKSTFVHPGGSGALECPRGPKFEKKSSYIRNSSVMGDKILVNLYCIELN